MHYLLSFMWNKNVLICEFLIMHCTAVLSFPIVAFPFMSCINTSNQRGQQFVDNCNKAQVGMDDMLPGFIIEGVLGVEITNIPEFTDQIHFTPPSDLSWYRRQVNSNTLILSLI